MKGKDAFLAVLAALEQLDLPYMVTGSFATNVYSIPRSTKDADVQKLRWVARVNRDKDFNDAVGVIRAQSEKLDWRYIEKWCAELEATEALAEARRLAEG